MNIEVSKKYAKLSKSLVGLVFFLIIIYLLISNQEDYSSKYCECDIPFQDNSTFCVCYSIAKQLKLKNEEFQITKFNNTAYNVNSGNINYSCSKGSSQVNSSQCLTNQTFTTSNFFIRYSLYYYLLNLNCWSCIE